MMAGEIAPCTAVLGCEHRPSFGQIDDAMHRIYEVVFHPGRPPKRWPREARDEQSAQIVSWDRQYCRLGLEAPTQSKMQIDAVGETGVPRLDHVRLHRKLGGL